MEFPSGSIQNRNFMGVLRQKWESHAANEAFHKILKSARKIHLNSVINKKRNKMTRVLMMTICMLVTLLLFKMRRRKNHIKKKSLSHEVSPRKETKLKKADACHVKQKAYLCTIWSRRSNEYVDGSDDNDDDDDDE